MRAQTILFLLVLIELGKSWIVGLIEAAEEAIRRD
jgi:hypothetical protein